MKNTVNEPIIEYVTSVNESIYLGIALFGGTKALSIKSSMLSDFDLLELTRRGIPKKAMLNLVNKITITLQEFAKIMHISERTFQRFEENALVKPEYSEKALELARLYARGEEVFGSLDKFKQWMKMPSHLFKGQTPFSLLDSSIGFDLVLKELGRIEHGIFS
ncbi:MAG: antitoxin Xre/MbcA/ParS toxin-binding domain-containing protein [Pelobium sp.]